MGPSWGPLAVFPRLTDFAPLRRAKYLFGPIVVRIYGKLPCQPFDDVKEFFEFRVFVEEIIGSELPAFSLVLGERIMGVHDHFGRVAAFPDFFENVDPVASRQADVEDRDVRDGLFDIAESVGNVEGHSHNLDPFDFGQDLSEMRAHQLRIIDYKKPKVAQPLSLPLKANPALPFWGGTGAYY